MNNVNESIDLTSDLSSTSNLIQDNKLENEIEERRKRSPFVQWLQVNNSTDAYKVESWLMRKSPIAYMVLRFLAKEMDNYNAVMCSYKVLEEALGYKRNALSKAVNLLKEHKYIDVKKSGISNIYFINKALYWKSWGKNYKYAEFGVKIIIAESEQEKEDNGMKNVKSEKIKQLKVTNKKQKF